jgi:hypothetical protein
MTKFFPWACIASSLILLTGTGPAAAACRPAVIEMPRTNAADQVISRDADLRLRRNCNSVTKDFASLGNLLFSPYCYQSKASIKAQIHYLDTNERKAVNITTSTVWLNPVQIPIDARTRWHFSGSLNGDIITVEQIYPGTEAISILGGTGTHDFTGATANGSGSATSPIPDTFPPDTITINNLSVPICIVPQ